MEQHLICPITHEIFKDPVTTVDGHTYERAAITAWFIECITHNREITSPVTNAPLNSTTLTPNLVCASLASEWRNFKCEIELNNLRAVFQAKELLELQRLYSDLFNRTSEFEETVQLFVRDYDGKTSTVNVIPSMTVEEFKWLMAEKFKVNRGSLRIIFKGIQLDDRRSLDSYQITGECTLHLISRIRGD